MFNWRTKLAHWLVKNQQEKYSNQLVAAGEPIRSGRGPRVLDRSNKAVNFTIHQASGGYVVETSFYDEKIDQHRGALHIITSQEDFAEELGKAVFMEMLKNR